ncbi:MAG: DUF58 domain-containing protein [Candidatus Competibacterales bacterium]
MDPGQLANLGNLELVARTVVTGFLSGLHRTAVKGASTEFAEHRPYQPGDDLRRLDWRVYARRDRLYIKEYEAESNAPLTLLLDVSRSMAFTTRRVTKFDYARFAAAALAWLGHRQRDRIGLIPFADRPLDTLPAGRAPWPRPLHALERLTPAGSGNIEAVAQAALSARRRGIVVVLSDFYAEPLAVAQALDAWRLRGHDVIALHILDPGEWDLPFDGQLTFEDLESGVQLATDPDRIRTRYRERLTHHRDTLATTLGARGMSYALVTTDQPLDGLLQRFLHQRARRRR